MKKVKIEKFCQECGVKFLTTNKQRIYCGEKCLTAVQYRLKTENVRNVRAAARCGFLPPTEWAFCTTCETWYPCHFGTNYARDLSCKPWTGNSCGRVNAQIMEVVKPKRVKKPKRPSKKLATRRDCVKNGVDCAGYKDCLTGDGWFPKCDGSKWSPAQGQGLVSRPAIRASNYGI